MNTKQYAQHKKRNTQRGIYAVEFAIVGSLFFLLLFAVLEIARLFFTWNVLTEVTRRSARLAVVCDLDQTNIASHTDMMNAALFNNNPLITNLTAANIQVEYLGLTGLPATTFSTIRYVRANIINYQHQLLLPGLSFTLSSPTFSTTLPRESLGVTRFGLTQCSPV